jgi:hypothetical protein
MNELLAEYQARMGWNEQSLLSIMSDYIEHTSKPGHTCMPFKDYVEQRALEEEAMGEEDYDITE